MAMIRALHVDRGRVCRPGAVLTLNDAGCSRFGQEYMQPVLLPYGQPATKDDESTFDSVLIEHFFELIRRCEFPHRPSRFQCVFGSEPNSDSALLWVNRPDFSGYPIWVVESKAAFKADAKLLRFTIVSNDQMFFNPEALYVYARYYWQGKSITQLLDAFGETYDPTLFTPEWELLLVPPVRVLQCYRHANIGKETDQWNV